LLHFLLWRHFSSLTGVVSAKSEADEYSMMAGQKSRTGCANGKSRELRSEEVNSRVKMSYFGSRENVETVPYGGLWLEQSFKILPTIDLG